jgi:hypothetical protein
MPAYRHATHPDPEAVMSRSFTRLRRALLGLSSAVVFGFGAPQALAGTDPELPPGRACFVDSESPYPYYTWYCGEGCPEGVGYCGTEGECHCGYIP